MNRIKIRRYQETDFDEMCLIHDQARRQELMAANLINAFKPLKVAAFEEDLFSYNIYMAIIAEKVVGFVAFTDDELAWLYVSPNCQNQGIGSKLIEFSLNKMKRPAYLEVLAGNPAKRLYLKKGFELLKHETGKMPGNEKFIVEVDVLEYKQV